MERKMVRKIKTEYFLDKRKPSRKSSRPSLPINVYVTLFSFLSWGKSADSPARLYLYILSFSSLSLAIHIISEQSNQLGL